MNFRHLIQDYFTFSRNERRGITILLILIFLLAIANKMIFYFETPGKIDSVLLDSASRELGLYNDSISRQSLPLRFFPFNPNTIDSVTLVNLDLPESVKLNVLRFRGKGGEFYSKADFRKIYGVTDSVYNQVAQWLLIEKKDKSSDARSSTTELFLFDPNKATDEEFFRLGLSEKQLATIRNYLHKGGSFRKKTDFLKIWGFTEKQKKELSDFVVIEVADNSRSVIKSETTAEKLELNSADSIQLQQLPGIGPKLSKRIVKYRDLLGGFYSVEQLTEVYGLSEQTIRVIEDKLKVDLTKIRKLNVNFSDVNELSRHPYLQKDLARQILKFRTKNGSIRDLAILRDSMILNIDNYTRLEPYF